MALNLLIDEDSQDRVLVAKLKNAGHNVLSTKEAGLLGQPDKVVLAYAVKTNRIILTRNCDDFCFEANTLKAAGGHHHGILLRYEKNDPKKDMTYDDIVSAINRIDNYLKNKQLVLIDCEHSLSYFRS